MAKKIAPEYQSYVNAVIPVDLKSDGSYSYYVSYDGVVEFNDSDCGTDYTCDQTGERFCKYGDCMVPQSVYSEMATLVHEAYRIYQKACNQHCEVYDGEIAHDMMEDMINDVVVYF